VFNILVIRHVYAFLVLLSFLFFVQVFPHSDGCINLDSEEVSFCFFSICALFVVYIYFFASLVLLFFAGLCYYANASIQSR
jgi:ABC-type uncharacterized transport system permease subunit